MAKKSRECFHYSGSGSKAFWKRISSIKDDKTVPVSGWWSIYSMGCELQNLEERVLSLLKSTEELLAQKKKEKRNAAHKG